MKKTMMVMLMVICAMILTVSAFGTQDCFYVEGDEITRSELEEAQHNAEVLHAIGVSDSAPDEREVLAQTVRVSLLEAEFEEHGITLTPEEESQAENSYADTRAAILAAIEDGSTDPNAARQTLETVQAYWEAMGWTEEEYARRAGESMMVSMKKAKLIETVYAGDGAALEAKLDAETEQVLSEAGYGAS